MFEFLFILLLFSLVFMLFAGLGACGIDLIFGVSIAHVVLGIGALVSASIFGLILMIAVIKIIIDYIKSFIDDHLRG